ENLFAIRIYNLQNYLLYIIQVNLNKMSRKLVTGKYTFCINSNYYDAIVQYVNSKNVEVENVKNCDNLSFNMNFTKNLSSEKICKEFKFFYKSLSENPIGKTTGKSIFSDYDCNFLNYWLNDKLRENSKKDNEDYINDDLKNKEKESCSKYTKECDENYKKAMDRCLNSNDDFYNALIYFKDSYKIITETSYNESNVCNSSEFYYFPWYDVVLEKKANAIKISSTLSILSLVLPLIYRYTPFGPFLRTKINMVKDRWINPDKNEDELLLLSTDIEDNISDNEEYNIGYYSETN
ncbi:PIR protein, partial [Plasmodium ovale]